MRAAFSREQDEKLFVANGIWQTANRFAEQRTTLANFTLHIRQISSRQFEAECWLNRAVIFLPNSVCRQLFSAQTKFGEIDLGVEMHIDLPEP
jgi:hypothetical protein